MAQHYLSHRMNKKRAGQVPGTKYMAALLCLAILFGPFVVAAHGAEKIVIGEVEHVALSPWGVSLDARIDTGACTSSLDARDVVVSGKTVRFTLPEKAGGTKAELPLIGWQRIRGAGRAGQRRPVVEIEICLGGKKFKTPFTLADRARMDYPILVGRQAITGDFVVDVSKSHLYPHPCPPGSTP